VINEASLELKKSEKFSQLLQLILYLGNNMNRNTYLSTNGFKLDSLLKLRETKAKSKDISFLDFLVMVATKKLPGVIHFYKDLRHIKLAVKIPLSAILESKQLIEQDLKELERELKMHNDDHFHNVMNPFFEGASKKFEVICTTFEESMNHFAIVAKYFGEDPQQTPPEQLFEQVHRFIILFKDTQKKSQTNNEPIRRHQLIVENNSF